MHADAQADLSLCWSHKFYCRNLQKGPSDQQKLKSACKSTQYGKGSCTSLWIARMLYKAHAISEYSDQTARMRSLIWVFAGRTRFNVGFVVLWLICYNFLP